MKFDVHSETHQGLVREYNQDNVYAWVAPDKPVALLVVADGMGGYKDGDVASRLAVETIEEIIQPALENAYIPAQALQDVLEDAIAEAHTRIYEYGAQNADVGRTGTTLIVVVVQKDEAVYANIGDSRIYLFRGEDIEKLTDDHTVVGEMVREGFLEEIAMHTHPQRNMLTRALGYEESTYADFAMRTILPGTRILLCSDGLWGMATDPELALVLRKPDAPEAAVKQLIQLALENGGDDNVGIVLCDVSA